MKEVQLCSKCKSSSTYQDGNLWLCLECQNEWDPAELATEEIGSSVVLDANGNELNTGDTVIVINDLKVKGSASGIKAGTKVKNIVIIESNNGHNISCKVDGVGSMYLKSELVKKV